MKPDCSSDNNEESEELQFHKAESTNSEADEMLSASEGNKTLSTAYEAGLTPGRQNLRKWLGKTFRVAITDGRVLVGFFNCTDKDANLVLSMCAEYLEEGKDARILGNVMVPGKHIVSISVDEATDAMETIA